MFKLPTPSQGQRYTQQSPASAWPCPWSTDKVVDLCLKQQGRPEEHSGEIQLETQGAQALGCKLLHLGINEEGRPWLAAALTIGWTTAGRGPGSHQRSSVPISSAAGATLLGHEACTLAAYQHQAVPHFFVLRNDIDCSQHQRYWRLNMNSVENGGKNLPLLLNVGGLRKRRPASRERGWWIVAWA